MKMMFSLFDTLLEPVFILNSEKKVVYCNEPAAVIVGQSVRKICKATLFSDLVRFSEPLDCLRRIDQITDATPYKELNFTTDQVEDGKTQITVQPIFDAIGDKNWLVFFRDVTLEERLQKKYRSELLQKQDVIEELQKAQSQLQDYNKNLEQLVSARTLELTQSNSTLSALINSLGQGFFIFNLQGVISPTCSKACETILGSSPVGKSIFEIFNFSNNETESFKKWMTTLFSEMLPFADLAVLGPDSLENKAGKHISLEYHPIRDDQGKITEVVVVASDITSLVLAQNEAETQRQHALLIVNLIKSKRQVHKFIEESEKSLAFIQEQTHSQKIDQPEELYRHLHTLKGGSAIFSAQDLTRACHEAEDLLKDYRLTPSSANLVALKSKSFEMNDRFKDFVSKTQEILGKHVLSTERQIEIALSKLNSIAKKLGAIPGLGATAQDLMLEVAMEPAQSFLAPYNEYSQKMAEKFGKKVSPIEINNGHILLMPEIYSPLFATFVHAFRNALDHGIEMPEARRALDKPVVGKITVCFDWTDASVAEKHLKISIQDDGTGIEASSIRLVLQKNNPHIQNLSDSEVIQHIFDSEFSTRESTTEYSGRGVGLNAVKAAAEKLNGKVWVESKKDQGTTIFIQVPYLTELTSSTDVEPADEVFSKAA